MTTTATSVSTLRGNGRTSSTLEVRGLTKRYGRTTAVEQLEFAVPAGCVFGLLGPNGSGKSSTLHVITGLLAPDAGTVRVCGHPHDSGAAKRAFGFVPDDLPLPTSLTGCEVLRLVERLRGDVDSALRDALVDVFDLKPALDRLVAHYSHGMKRKLQVVAALMHRPRLLILDEPFRGLDPEAVVVMREVLASVTRATTTSVIVATHDLAAADRLCDEVLILAAGRVAAQGRPQALRRQYAVGSLEDAFLVATGLLADAARHRRVLAAAYSSDSSRRSS